MSELRDLLLVFEWLSARTGCTVAEACARFGIERAELEGIVDTLAQVGFLPESPDLLLSAYIDDENDTVHVEPFDGLGRGVSIEVETALRLESLGAAFLELMPTGSADVSRRAIERLRASLRASGIDPAAVAADLALPGSDMVPALGSAIADREQLCITYRAPAGEVTERTIDPIGLFLEGGWYLEAFDHLRGARRHFKLERIVGFERTGEHVSDTHVATGTLHVEGGDTTIVLELDPTAGWLLEHLEGASVANDAGGRRTATLTAGGYRWIVPLLIAAGPAVTIIEPLELRDAVREEIDATLAAYR